MPQYWEALFCQLHSGGNVPLPQPQSDRAMKAESLLIICSSFPLISTRTSHMSSRGHLASPGTDLLTTSAN
jgi:hypothetical protein